MKIGYASQIPMYFSSYKTSQLLACIRLRVLKRNGRINEILEQRLSAIVSEIIKDVA